MPQLKFQNQEIQNILLKISEVLEGPQAQRGDSAESLDNFAFLALMAKQSFERIMEAIPKLKGLGEIIEKLPQKSPTLLTMASMISELNSVLAGLCKLPFAAFFVVIGRVGRISSH